LLLSAGLVILNKQALEPDTRGIFETREKSSHFNAINRQYPSGGSNTIMKITAKENVAKVSQGQTNSNVQSK